jgi:hypothetical protein
VDAKTRLLGWINDHRWMTAIGVLNLMALVAALFYSDIWMLLAIQVPIGALVIGLLFVPRKHLVDRMMTSAMARFASLGVGGVLITILLIATRSILKRARRNDGDFSFLTDLSLSGIGSMLISFLVFAACLAGFAFLWRLFGVARVLAAGYLGAFAIFLLSFVTVGTMRERRERRSDERMQAMQDRLSELNGPNATHSPGMRAWTGGDPAMQNGSPMIPAGQMSGRPQGRFAGEPIGSPSQIQIVVHHELGANVDAFRDRLVAQAGISSHQRKTRGKITELIFKYDGTPDELAKMIDTGSVTEVNEDLRTIVISLDR